MIVFTFIQVPNSVIVKHFTNQFSSSSSTIYIVVIISLILQSVYKTKNIHDNTEMRERKKERKKDT